MCSAQSWWKDAEWDSVATYRRIGMLTIPKLMTPFHMERGIATVILRELRRSENHRP